MASGISPKTSLKNAQRSIYKCHECILSHFYFGIEVSVTHTTEINTLSDWSVVWAFLDKKKLFFVILHSIWLGQYQKDFFFFIFKWERKTIYRNYIQNEMNEKVSEIKEKKNCKEFTSMLEMGIWNLICNF